ncbi:Cmx/CmrA family chloramphenicol efflux MFS transporter [Amycolatopsis sp. PS_44_ISF1]|uniref:Cmx/CmrA family chloramphenicol efflux MFS transporter n=1 Tax=Amycolatopsis sp. PS_44_ISF1 TaxID=2974917 RepID=UPI0028DD8497|nr:Cmx/CmrA family chloramphenicol efflux MFS transporter [Amycolatopsis sp. PS_44_ISF1]MDT8913342.1 Cmx/CmrA family chloramphenicol efflux MFS transporter [Amycolatopsis sp. PS_44_ISF1]
MPFALYLLAVAVFAMGTSEFMVAGLAPDLAARLGVPIGSIGLLTSAFAVGMAVGAPVTAVFARRWTTRTALLGFVLVFAAAHVAAAAATSFPALLVTRVAAALANAGFLAAALTAAARLAPGREGRALAVLLAGTTVATIAGVPAGSVLGSLLGWRATFWALALLCLPAAWGVVRGFPARRKESAGPAAPPLAVPPSAAPPSAVPPLAAEFGRLKRPRLVLVMALGALVNAATFATFTFLAPIVTGTAGLAAWWVPVVLVLFGLGAFTGVTAAGRLADRWPGRVLAIGGPLLLAGWLALATLAAWPFALPVLVFAQGALSFALGSTLIARVLHESAAAPTLAGSYATAALNLGAAGGPALAALTLGPGPGDLGPVWISALLVAIALLLIAALRPV